MTPGLTILPGTQELAKNLLTLAMTLASNAVGKSDAALIGAVFQGLVALKIAEQLPGVK